MSKRPNDAVENSIKVLFLKRKERAEVEFDECFEEAEEIAALNLAKYRQAQGGLADAEERADLNEQALAKYKARGRSASLAPQVPDKFSKF